jgi:DNA polymerase-3 subunit epsilon
MSVKGKLIVAALGACLYLLGAVIATGGLLWADFREEERQFILPMIEQRAGGILMALMAACSFTLMIVRALHHRYVVETARRGEEALALLRDPARRLTVAGSSELQGLLRTVNRLAELREVADADVAGRIRAANAAAEEERNRFAALIADLGLGVVVCNLGGQVLLYNPRARDLFPAQASGGGVPLGLGRSIYTLFDRQMIAHGLERVANKPGATSHFIAAAPSGRLLRVQVAPVRAAGGSDEGVALAGYLLMLDDITATFESESHRDALLQDLTEGSRGPLGNLRAAVETLENYPDMEAEQRARFLEVIREEAERLGKRVEAASRDFAAMVKARWRLEEMRGADLLAAAQRRIEARLGIPVTLEEVADDQWIMVDSFSMLQAMTYLATRLREEHWIRDLPLRFAIEGNKAHLDLICSSAFMSTKTVTHWEYDPMYLGGETTPLTLRDVIDRCGGEVWFQRARANRRAYFRFLLPAVVPKESAQDTAVRHDDLSSRPEFYDFDLFRWSGIGGDLDNRPLTEFDYTVFDTETTGLDPSGGDEIIQIGAVRIVNKRLLRSECFEQLIDPQRPLPHESTEIHGITPDMLRGQPTIDRVLPAFRAFVGDTVLVGHNAAFDMRFLEIKEAATGVRFDRPVLDTFLLSAVLFASHETHRLEMIAERLGVSIVGRHTAVGDAIITGELFLKMIPLLAEKGIRTLGQAREAEQRTYHARLSY